MKILVTGETGQLGRCLRRASETLDFDWTFVGRQACDLSRPESIRACFEAAEPDLVINAAAYTAVDKAEDEPDLAYAVNADGPSQLAQLCRAHGSRMLHVSTDYVCDGESSFPYSPNDATNPLGVYGSTKREGERAVLGQCHQAVVLRTSWVFSEFGGNFVKTMVRLAAERPALRVVADQRGRPTYAGHLADAIMQWVADDGQRLPSAGILHYADTDQTDWASFARAIVDMAATVGLIAQPPSVEGIATQEYPTPARRPMNSVLAVDVLAAKPWRAGLQQVLDALQASSV